MKRFLLMLQFFTRIPINKELDIKENDFAKGIIFFPIVGLIIGGFNVLVYLLFKSFSSGILPLIMVTLANVLITGALHIDGLADTCDGIFSARKKEKMLEIMKDSRIGTNGTIAIFFDLGLRIALMSYINPKQIVSVILLTSIISRMMLGVLSYISSKGKNKTGLGSLFIGKVILKDTIITIIVGVLLSCMFLGYGSLVIIVINFAFMYLYRNYIFSKISVMTGDTLGAANELSEILILIITIIIGRYGLL
jgi:adenosylcobinamide-GDP ribazoletransferase